MEFIKSRILVADQRDQQVWQLVSDVPEVSQVWAVAIFLLNIVFPGSDSNLYYINVIGLGTIVLSVHYDRCSKTTFAIGVLQLLTAAFVVGWILSIYWGALVLAKAFHFNIPGLNSQSGGLPMTNVVAGMAQKEVNQFIQNDFIRSDQQPPPGAQYGGFPQNTRAPGGSNLAGYR